MTIQREVDAILEQKWEAGTQIRLNNVPMEIQGGIGYQLTNVYPRPERQGEPGPADHPFNATHTQRTWVGGQLHRDLQEAADISVYWDAHAWVQNRGKLGAPLLTRKIEIPQEAKNLASPPDNGGMVIPHKRMNDGFIFTVGNVDGYIYEYTAPERALRHPGGGIAPEKRFDGVIMNKGVVFQALNHTDGEQEKWLYLPSTAGYTRMRDDYTRVQAPGSVSGATIGMAIHENKLYRLVDGGVVQTVIYHDDNWLEIARVPDGSDPRNIYETFDDDGNRCIGVTTSTGLFLLDHDNGILWQTDLQYPEHAYQGYGVCRWRADDYVSVGVGIHRRVGNLVTPEGLDNYDGLPDPLAGGFITDLAPSYNWLLAAVAGQLSGEDVHLLPTEEMFGLTQNIPYPITSAGTAANFLGTNRVGAIFAWNGLGWAKLYQWNRPAERVEVSMIRNRTKEELQQHLFFGDSDGGCFVIQIPSSYYNPLISPTLPLERQWYLEEGRLDWDTADTPKLAKQFNCKVDQLYHQMTPPGGQPHHYHNEIHVICHWQDLDGIYHRSDDLNDLVGGPNSPGPWPFVDEIENPGEQHNPVGYLRLKAGDVFGNSRRSYSIGWERYTQDGTILATGLPHLEIWMEYRGYNDTQAFEEGDRPVNEFTSGVLEWRSIIGRKWMRPNRVFTFVIDVQTAIKGESEDTIMAFLDACCLKVGGVPLVVNDRFYIVDVTRLDGANEPGLSPRGTRTITCLEFTDITYEDSVAGFEPR